VSERAHIIVVDDHAVARKTICALPAEPDFAVICDVTNGADAVIHARQLQPDVVVLDISMPGMDGMEAARQIKRVAPKTEILFLTQHDELPTIRQAFGVGARGYVVKSDAGKELIPAIHAVRQTSVFEPPLLNSCNCGGESWGRRDVPFFAPKWLPRFRKLEIGERPVCPGVPSHFSMKS
jgi:DNA-binding NarL/FixJ family response regulator